MTIVFLLPLIFGGFYFASAASTPVLNWVLDEGTGTSFSDSSGNGYSGTTYNSPTWVSGGGLNFNGTNQYARSNSALSGTLGRVNEPYTISAQVRIASDETNGNIIHVSNGANGIGWCIPMLRLVDGKFAAYSWSNNAPVAVATTTNATTGQWYSLATTWDPDSDLLKLYIDGTLAASTFMDNFSAANENVYIFPALAPSTCSGDVTYFKGDIRNIVIDAQAMTQAEIQGLYAPTVASFSPADDATTVDVDTDLVIEFEEAVSFGTGNIVIKKTSDDTTIESIDVTGDQVTGDGTDTVTITLSEDLPGDTEVYVTIPETAFVSNDVYFAGIDDDTTWTFTTIETYSNQFSLTGTAAATGTVSVALPITDVRVIGNSASTTPVKLLVSNGTLAFGTVDGLTFSGDESGSELYFSGTVANVNAALATLTYTRGGTGTDTLEISLVEEGEVFFPDNNHIYMVVNENVTANTARTRAQTYVKYGFQGYLANITSLAENNYVKDRLSTAGWIGGSDAASEGVWKWLDGPEAGQQFWSGAAGGSVTNDLYANWNTGEPNDYSTGEDCAQFLSGSTGLWNDLPCNSSTIPFVVEFGDDSGEELIASLDISIVTVNAPTVASLSPADNAEDVAVNTNLTINFSQDVSTSTGNILIKKSIDDTTVHTIRVGSSSVSRASSSAFTIDPESDLEEQTAYYVTIPSTAFKNGSDIYFEGISATTTWNFTTGDFTATLISSVASDVTSSTTVDISWTTNEDTSTQVWYGPTSSYTASTTVTDTSPRVRSHEETLTGLLACTRYHYAVVSTDASLNTSTSSDYTFTTTGCEGNTVAGSATTTSVVSNTGGSTRMANGNTAITVSAPANFTATSSSVVIQIKTVSGSDVLNSTGRPTSALQGIGNIVFDVKAIIDGSTILDSFDQPVTITYTYEDADISSIDESTLWLYHYHNDTWEALENCTVNQVTNTISCTTDSFSIFSLFGEQAQASTGMMFGYYVPTEVVTPQVDVVQKQSFSLHDLLLKLLAALRKDNTSTSDNVLVSQEEETYPVESAQSTEVRDLFVDMEGEDVTMLQKILIREQSGPMASELQRVGATGYFGFYTQNALREYQEVRDIQPSSGYFGRITRGYMKSNLVEGLWW